MARCEQVITDMYFDGTTGMSRTLIALTHGNFEVKLAWASFAFSVFALVLWMRVNFI